MERIFQKIITIFILFLSSALASFAGEPLKINGLVFDNSDGIIFMDTKGEIDETNVFKKGYLKDPERVYVDIENAILTTQKKSYSAKYSVFNNIKISQFTTEPNTVRIVFEYNKGLDLSSFQTFKSKNSIFIKTKKELINSPEFKIVYSNTKTADRTQFYQGAKFEEISILSAEDLIKDEITKETSANKASPVQKAASTYYIDSILSTKNGILINGMGKLSLMPSFSLQNPERLIIDLDDTVVSQELRNKTFAIGEIQTKQGQTPSLDKRETLKIGQNSQSVARLVIQGEFAKEYRGIVSPDSKSLYLTKKSNIINSKMSDENANLTQTSYSTQKENAVMALTFDDSVSFDVFEENNNLYLDVNNLNVFSDEVIAPLKKAVSNLQTTRLALDKMRFVIPNMQDKNINLKTNPDNTEIKIFSKSTVQKPKPSLTSYIPISLPGSKKQPEISNYFTVVIDAGHGGADVGATRNNIYEKDITLKISKYLEKELNKKKVKTYMVRDKDKTVSLAERCEFSNEKKPDVFVSIHVNSSTNDTSYGVETHWYKQDSLTYAQYVHKEMSKRIKGWKTLDRGLINSKFYVINHTEAPAILCEIGFISNPNEREEIIKTKRQEEIAQAVAEGIYNYLKAKK